MEPEAAGTLPVAELAEWEAVAIWLPTGTLALLGQEPVNGEESAPLRGLVQGLVTLARAAWIEREKRRVRDPGG